MKDLKEIQGQLPFWPDDLRGVPLATLRSALFAPVKPGTRASMKRKQIANVGNVRIIYTGFQLDQADFDVYQQVLHLARQTPLGKQVKFKTREMLQALGRKTGGSDRTWLLDSLSRLSANEIEVSDGARSYAGSLIQEQARDQAAGVHFVVLNPKLAALYDQQGWTPMRWETRKALGSRQLAKWLYGFIQGQRRPLTFAIADLMGYANSRQKRERDFRRSVDTAAASINGLGGNAGVVLLWDMDRHQVTITRSHWRAD